MSRLVLRLANRRAEVRLPEDLRESFAILSSHPRETDDDGPLPLEHRFELARRGADLVLMEDGIEKGRFRDPAHALLALEYRLELAVVEAAEPWLALHAGAAARDGRAIVLAGRPEAGKTSATFQLVELGLDLLAEEIVLVDPATLAVHPHLQSLALHPGFVDAFRSRYGISAGTVHRLGDAICRYVPYRPARAPATLETLVLPRYDPSSPASRRELAPETALSELLPHCFEPQVDEEVLFDRVISLVNRCPAVELTYPDIDSARRALAGLLPPS